MDLGAFVYSHRRHIENGLLRREGWSLEDPRAQNLLEKLRNAGVALKNMFDSCIYRGPVTGLNEAFIVDDTTRRELIAESKSSAQILKPLLRGRDIDRWRPRESGMHLIFANKGVDIDRYPAIKRHLSRFRTQLEPKPRDWSQGPTKWPGRKSGDYSWYELQDPIGEEFKAAMFGKKILYQEIQYHSWFCLETDGAFVNNKVFLIPSADLCLLALLNSPLMWWQLSRVLPHMKDEALCPASFVMESVHIPQASKRIAEEIEPRAQALLELSECTRAWEAEALEVACDLLTDSQGDRRILSWLPLSTDVFTTRILKLSDLKNPSRKLLADIVEFQQRHRARQVEMLSRQLEIEKRLAVLAEDAYGLTLLATHVQLTIVSFCRLGRSCGPCGS